MAALRRFVCGKKVRPVWRVRVPGPGVLITAKTYGNVFDDTVTRSIARRSSATGLPAWPRRPAIPPVLPRSRVRIIEPAAALDRARNVCHTGVALRGRTAWARGAYMENVGMSLRVGCDV
jgi:hypothetical protein